MKGIIDSAASVAVIALSILVSWSVIRPHLPVGSGKFRNSSTNSAPLPTEPLDLDGFQIKGSENAPVVMVEFSDYQCPFCASFAKQAIRSIERNYVSPGKLRLAFAHFPLSTIHKQAFPAALTAECAGDQGKFWPMHDYLFANQKQLADGGPELWARAIGINLPQFQRCLSSDITKKLGHAVERAQRLQVRGTPTVFIGTREPGNRMKVMTRFSGAIPTLQIQAAIESIIAGNK